MLGFIRRKAIAVTRSRPPDVVVGDEDNPYMLRWHWLPRNKYWFNIYVHRFLKDDDDRALHDHPWASISLMCEGNIREEFLEKHLHGETYTAYRDISAGEIVYRKAKFAHRIIIMGGMALPLTIFITGPRIREWGFHCAQGWRHWKDFVDMANPGTSGRGCGEMDDDQPAHCRTCGIEFQRSFPTQGECPKHWS